LSHSPPPAKRVHDLPRCTEWHSHSIRPEFADPLKERGFQWLEIVGRLSPGAKSATLAGLGIATGLVAAALLSGTFRHLLFGVAPLDVASFAGSAVVDPAAPLRRD
jgi:hypothetical protein